MVWTPRENATDIRPIVSNLLSFFEDHQVEVFTWVQSSPVITPFTKFYPTAEMWMMTDFPHFGMVKRDWTTENADDGLKIEYRFVFQFEVATEFTLATRFDALKALQADCDKRYYAIESMYLNIPSATLFANLHGAQHGYRSITRGDPIEHAIDNTSACFNVEMNAILKFTENPR